MQNCSAWSRFSKEWLSEEEKILRAEQWRTCSKSYGWGSKGSPRKSGKLYKNVFFSLPRPFRQQLQLLPSSEKELPCSLPDRFREEPIWLLQDTLLPCPRCSEVHLGFNFPRFPPAMGASAPAAWHWRVNPMGSACPQPSSTGNRLLNICLEHLTLYLDVFKVVNSTHHGCRGKPPTFFSRKLMGRNLSRRCSDEQNA